METGSTRTSGPGLHRIVTDQATSDRPNQAGIAARQADARPKRTAREKFNQFSTLAQRSIPGPADFATHEYAGWRVAGPRVQLRWIINFLSDEDIDRTPDWDQKCAEIMQYLSYLTANLAGQDWTEDLLVAVEMLRTHQLFEQYHYGQPQLSFEFRRVLPMRSTRLPQLPGPNIRLNIGGQGNVVHTNSKAPTVKATSTGIQGSLAGQAGQGGNIGNPSSRAEPPHQNDSQMLWSSPPSRRPVQTAEWIRRFGNTPDNENSAQWWHQTGRAMHTHEMPDTDLIPIKCVETVPEKESQDPLTFVRLHNEYQRRHRRWAIIAGQYAGKAAPGRENLPVVTTNWRGPKVFVPGEESEVNVFKTLKNYRGLKEGIGRRRRQSPRPFIVEVLRYIDLGITGGQPDISSLRFRAAERGTGDNRAFAPLSDVELQFLYRLCQQSHRRPEELDQPLDELGKILAARITRMLADKSAESFFRNNKRRLLHTFVNALNKVCRGPLLQYKFTEEEVLDYLPAMTRLGLVSSQISKTTTWIARPEANVHPEDRLVWPQGTAQTQDDNDGDQSMPLPYSTRSLRDCFKPASQVNDQQEKIENFFYCLAFRLGLSLADLEAKFENTKSKPRGPSGTNGSQQPHTWQNPGRRPAHTIPEEPTYRSIVTRVGPSALASGVVEDNESPESHRRISLVEELCKRIVRRNILREAYNNHTMLWPSNIRFFKDAAGAKVTSFRREPIWSFGRPSVRGQAPQYWSLNRWPLELQSREMQDVIRASGPKDGEPGLETETVPDDAQSQGRNHKSVRWADMATQRRVFVPGVTEYWAGDTPKQKKAIENQLRNKFETKPPMKSIWRSFLTGQRKQDRALKEAEPLRLPPLAKWNTPRSISPVRGGEDQVMGEATDEPEVEDHVMSGALDGQELQGEDEYESQESQEDDNHDKGQG